ncbi:magnesium/cobalt transporter CorA [Flavicella sediminum]|uniref:magnesium/cobalt transporter CorA n=1 Tax=Flavicella sediminum TaxID=2585141 RepID=UPI00111E6CE9|nr:magnesium/cobalt transporter CorA [Flavicella sediminum]
MSKNISRKNGLIPGSMVYIGNKTDSELYIEVFNYDKNTVETKEFEKVSDVLSFEIPDQVTWVNLYGLNHVDEIEKLCSHYKIHPLVMEDIINTKQRPKNDDYEGYLFTVLKMLYFDKDGQLKIENVSMVLGANYLLTFQEDEGDVFEHIRERLLLNKGRIRGQGSDYLQYALMDAIIDNYFSLIETMGEKIEVLEDLLFENNSESNIISEIQALKREILKIRRAVFPLREVISKIEKSDSPLIHEKTQLYLRDLYDHIIHVSESVDIYREMIWGIMDMYMSTISNRMNEVMKVLTIIATIFIPLTFIAGIYGMNFKYIPELEHENGYFILWGVMLVVFAGMVYYFKRKKWL